MNEKNCDSADGTVLLCTAGDAYAMDCAWRNRAESADHHVVRLRVHARKKERFAGGFFCGLLTDIFFGQVIGFYAIIYMYIGYANGMFHRVFFPEDIKLPLFLITVSDLAYGFAVYVLLYLLRGRFELPFYFLHVILPEMVYTIVLTVLVYPVNLKINRKFDEIEKRSEKKFV